MRNDAGQAFCRPGRGTAGRNRLQACVGLVGAGHGGAIALRARWRLARPKPRGGVVAFCSLAVTRVRVLGALASPTSVVRRPRVGCGRFGGSGSPSESPSSQAGARGVSSGTRIPWQITTGVGRNLRFIHGMPASHREPLSRRSTDHSRRRRQPGRSGVPKSPRCIL